MAAWNGNKSRWTHVDLKLDGFISHKTRNNNSKFVYTFDIFWRPSTQSIHNPQNTISGNIQYVIHVRH